MTCPPGQPGARPVRVAHLVESLEVGGLERLLVEFARHADRDRFALHFVTLGAPGHLAADVEALGWPVRSFRWGPGLRPRAVPALAAWFRRERIDVLHAHTSGPLLYGTLAARLGGVGRVVSTRHHGPDVNNSPRAIRACALMTALVDRVVCVSQDGLDHSLAEGVSASRLVTIRNGIDLSRFAYGGPCPAGPAVVVARLSPEKGHATLLHALARVRTVEPTFRLDIAGDGPRAAELRDLAGRLALGESVRFLGPIDDVSGLLAGASLAVLSSWKEGVALSLLEAMARGLPVVATRAGGTPEVVEDGRTGWLVPPGDAEAMAEAILRVWRDPEAARALGREGRARVEAEFDVRAMVAAYEAIYTEGRPRLRVPGPAREPRAVEVSPS